MNKREAIFYLAGEPIPVGTITDFKLEAPPKHLTTRVRYLFMRYRGPQGGHIRIFGSKAPNGFVVYTWHQSHPEDEKHRVWNFSFFAIHHVSHAERESRQYRPVGWHITFAAIRFPKIQRGFGIQFH